METLNQLVNLPKINRININMNNTPTWRKNEATKE